MHIKSLEIKNFRALEDINVEFDNRVNIIVGPNAIGKTTILEAIRLSKAVLFPRTQNETMQALIALGAASPHLANQFNVDTLTRDKDQPITISVRYELSEQEVEWLLSSLNLISREIVQARMGQTFSNPTVLLNFLGTPQGAQALAEAHREAEKTIEATKNNNRQCKTGIKISSETGIESINQSIWPILLATLDKKHPPGLASFSYFPADRALPHGEQGIQIGAADAQAQLESHNSQPQTKYTRLKNTIFNTLLMSDQGREELATEFERIFSGILKGRRLDGFGLSHLGLFSIFVEDIETGRKFEIDGMSSGEKGLILTFLLIEKSVAQDGLILLDEPELHLNPAVCKDLLSFIVGGYAVRKNLQIFVCSHSPEILTGAFENEECSLYHLVSERLLTKVRRQDYSIISDALRRLGSSESEELLYKGTVFVEGVDDAGILETGFGEIFRRYKIKDLGGRKEIEKEIKFLQSTEKQNPDHSLRFFIFDRDDKPTDLASSNSIKILQWERRCLENYLIDFDVLTDLLQNEDIVNNPIKSIGEVQALLRELAFSQLDDLAARNIYIKYNFINPGLRTNEIQGKNIEEISTILSERLLEIKSQINKLDLND